MYVRTLSLPGACPTSGGLAAWAWRSWHVVLQAGGARPPSADFSPIALGHVGAGKPIVAPDARSSASDQRGSLTQSGPDALTRTSRASCVTRQERRSTCSRHRQSYHWPQSEAAAGGWRRMAWRDPTRQVGSRVVNPKKAQRRERVDKEKGMYVY